MPSIGSGGLPSPPEPQPSDYLPSSPVDPICTNAREINTRDDEDRRVFDNHDLRGRLAFMRQLIARMEAKWGSLPRWPAKFTRDWPDIKSQGKEVVHNWFGEIKELLRHAWKALAFLSCLLHGVSPMSADECRTVFLQMQRMSSDLQVGAIGLELRLDLVMEQYLFINLSL